MTKTKTITLPNSKESEMMVLGCMLTNINSLNISANALNESDFFFKEHKIIFQVLKIAHQKDKPADIHIIAEALKRQNKLDSVGGLAYLTLLAQYVGTSAFIEEYIEQIKIQSIQRSLIDFAKKIQDQAIKQEDPFKIILEAQEKIKIIEKRKNNKEKFPICFINQFEQNFLIKKPPPKPMLLEYINEKALISGFLPKGIVAMLVGAGGVGKTHLLAQLAISVAGGTPWLDTFTTTAHCGENKQGSVFIGLGENQYDDIHRILYKASKKLREHQPDIVEKDPIEEICKRIAVFSFCGQQAAFIENAKPSLYFRELKMRLTELAPKDGWSLIILDPISRLLGTDAEVDNAAATQFIALLEELTIDLPGNPTILCAHHVNKSSLKDKDKQDQTAARGSSALTDGVRWQMNFTRLENSLKPQLTLKMTKSNFTSLSEDIILEREEDGFLNRYKEINLKPGNIKF